MYRMLVAPALALATFALPAAAEEFSSRYTINGQYDLIVDGTPMTAWTTLDTERNRSSVERHKVMGKVFYNVNGSVPASDGDTDTLLSVQLWPDHVSDIQYLDGGMFGADIAGGSMTLDGPPQIEDDGTMKFSFHGTLVEFAIKDGDFAPVEGGRVIEISGSYDGRYPVD
ncbi:MAG: hypothetical protein GC146_14165 [Limimaricola sp.]|uniref:hypothetical protein n=1 Tax=Limimaricola sp. TaxID=2211665 RepID=UPI001D5E6191|nr:hypothetical protein [Limimaricola sp.]MBI1418362.1 hypothetical protein [Limimaricola sp.]